MTIHCPKCASPSPVDDTEIGDTGCMVMCGVCGTRWLARRFEQDPYRSPGLQLQPFVPQASDISDAVVIEHVSPGFAKIPPHHRELSAPRRVPGSSRNLKMFATILGAIALVMVFRSPIVAALPELSAIKGLPEEVAGLEFQRVRSETVHINGVTTLFVEGEIINRSAADVELPAIRVTLKSPEGEAVTSWLVEPSAPGLAAGRSIGFRSALASPPADATQVTLNLALREAQIIGLR